MKKDISVKRPVNPLKYSKISRIYQFSKNCYIVFKRTDVKGLHVDKYNDKNELGSAYGGIDTINRSPSILGFNPNGDETMAFSICLRVCQKKKRSCI